MKTTETKHTPTPWSENKNYRDGYKSAMLTDENTKLGWENSEKSKSWKSYTDKPVSDYWRGYADGLLSKREHAALCAVAEAAESFKAVGQYWLNYPLGIPMQQWSVDDRTRYVAAEKSLNKALTNLAAVRHPQSKLTEAKHNAFPKGRW